MVLQCTITFKQLCGDSFIETVKLEEIWNKKIFYWNKRMDTEYNNRYERELNAYAKNTCLSDFSTIVRHMLEKSNKQIKIETKMGKDIRY